MFKTVRKINIYRKNNFLTSLPPLGLGHQASAKPLFLQKTVFKMGKLIFKIVRAASQISSKRQPKPIRPCGCEHRLAAHTDAGDAWLLRSLGDPVKIRRAISPRTQNTLDDTRRPRGTTQRHQSHTKQFFQLATK